MVIQQTLIEMIAWFMIAGEIGMLIGYILGRKKSSE